MYKRNIETVPVVVTRTDFVTELWQYCNIYSSYMLYMATVLGDKYVTVSKSYYSIELAHTVLVLCSKYLDCNIYSTREAATSVSNRIVYTLERTVLIAVDYDFGRVNIVTVLYLLWPELYLTGKFDSYIRAICLDSELIVETPDTLLIAIAILLTQ